MSIYKQVFSESIKRVWKNKIIWFFGLFTIFFSGSIELELLDNLFNNGKNIYYYIFNFINGSYNPILIIKNLFISLGNDPVAFFSLLLAGFLVLILLIIMIFLAMVAQIAIVKQIYNLKRNNLINDPSDKIKLIDVIKTNIKTAVSLGWLNIVFKVVVFLGLSLVALPIALTATKKSLVADIGYMILFIIITMFIIMSAMIMRFITINIAVKNLVIKKAVLDGWQMFKNNWLISIETSFMLFITTIIATFTILKLIIPAIYIPFYYLNLALTYLPIKQFVLISYGIMMFLAFVIFVTSSAIISAFNIAIWTDLYSEIDKNPVESRISQIFNRFIKK